MAQIYENPRSKFIYALYFVGGERKRESTKRTSRREAQKEADRLEREAVAAYEEAKRIAAAPPGIKLIAAADEFFTGKSLRQRSIDNYNSSLANIYRIVGDIQLRDITVDTIDSYVRSRRKEGVTVAIKRDLAFLSSLTAYAMTLDRTIERNMAKEYDKSQLQEAKERIRHLTANEAQRLLNEARTPIHRLFVILAIYTGMRSGEIKNLEWSEIDLKNAIINLPAHKTKTNTGREVPLTKLVIKELRAFIATLPATPAKGVKRTDYVFENPKTGRPITTFKTWFLAACRRAKIKDFRIHDMRHTFVTWGREADIEDSTLMDIVGHKSPSMMRRYGHATRGVLKNAAKKLDVMEKRTARS